MQAFLLIPPSEWKKVLEQLARLEETEQQRSKDKPAPPADEILNVWQAATRLGMTPAGVCKVRRGGRLKRNRLNKKEWSFYTSELHRYQIRISGMIE
ncbi:hypothetical protein PK28_17050 (plasmid) [Hymenobacter sp. DG25B]|uniref:hypothetical protein n=1 Tax=Hymenobacter sp. DG25B TaxID=1385664 RepID=UPI000541173B|nr:hypothetical protein [Hymenobacter sp. DG25B]AIZ65381.1 hypothetical protein PK28_17050 [Hymenobacter sp. DG25B]